MMIFMKVNFFEPSNIETKIDREEIKIMRVKTINLKNSNEGIV